MSGPSHRPCKTDFMDESMSALWSRMDALPGDLRLYGGAALALYLSHRPVRNFVFATPLPVIDVPFVKTIRWLDDAEFSGVPGMVDCTWHGADRAVKLTFVGCGAFIPPSTCEPVRMSNGIAVASPYDLIASKIEALITRGATRDAEDLAAAARTWRDLCVKVCLDFEDRYASSIARSFSGMFDSVDRRTGACLLALAQDVLTAMQRHDDQEVR